jgi:hypothetical protein
LPATGRVQECVMARSVAQRDANAQHAATRLIGMLECRVNGGLTALERRPEN